MIVFYARCSTIEQNEARQLEDARTCHAEKIFIDKASGKDTNRKQLKAMLRLALSVTQRNEPTTLGSMGGSFLFYVDEDLNDQSCGHDD